MKLLKKISSVMAALLIAVNLFAVSSSAAFAAPVVAGEEIAETLIALLLGAGHSQSELDGMSVTQMQSLVIDDMNSGKITFNTRVKDPVTNTVMGALEFLNKPESQVALSIIDTAVDDFVGDVISTVDGSVELNEGYFTAISTTDIIDGYGACLVMPAVGGGGITYHYCQYAVIDPEDNSICVRGPILQKTEWNSGKTTWSPVYNYSLNWGSDLKSQIYSYYGDIRYKDGTEAPTDDEYTTELGETADGTKITADMLNPDGTVTIDGVTYYPSDYLDPDKLTDEGKDALLAALLAALANAYVKSDDKPIVDIDDITVEVAEEFQDYAVPVGIANIFPFCIPWDIIRGFQLLNCPSVTPKFEIPFNIPEFGLFPGVEKSITLDFSEYDKYIQIFRWFQIIGFSFLLCKLSLTRVKGAGA